MVERKSSIRKAMKVAFAQMDKDEQQEVSLTLQDVLFESDLWQKAQTIGTYLSVGSEWDTRAIVNRAFQDGKKVAVPKTIPKTKELIFYEMTDWSQINKDGYFGLDEPDVEKTTPVKKDAIDLLIVPGLVFTKKGYRVGFGGGYYDRYLTDFIQPTVSLVHTKQFVEDFPIEPFDIPVQYLVTEKGIII